MPRDAREKSKTGIYHVMLRGIDKRNLFFKDADYLKLIEYVAKAREKSEFTIYAYCLMTNHIHFLLKTQTEIQDLGDIIRRITVGYVQYHNIRYGRTGHLFQNRYRSEAVEDDAYFLTVLRYIHQNPLKAGIVRSLESYKWSSYNDYLSNKNNLIDPTFGLKFFKDVDHFEVFSNEPNKDTCLENNLKIRYTDDDLKEYISSFVTLNTLPELEVEYRDRLLNNIKELTRASNRQLSRVLNIGRGILDRAK